MSERQYYYLLEFTCGVWCVYYGSYDRSEVLAEETAFCESFPEIPVCIVQCGDKQSDIDDVVSILNQR